MTSEERPINHDDADTKDEAANTGANDVSSDANVANATAVHASLKYSLLGPSLTKAGQDSVSEIIYTASKGSKYFNREEAKDRMLTAKIDQILAKKRSLETLDLSHELRAADNLIAQLELSRDLTQHIVHIDCDAFYAAVEQLDRPELKDLPFAVGFGVLTTCNYVARRFGCRSGMAGFVAKKLCPELVLLPLNFDKYNAKAAEVREVLAEYDPRFESASIDEAYLNITEYCSQHGMSPADAVAQLRSQVHERTHITVSAGIAANAKLAKICSNLNKPNGQFVLPRERAAIMVFMRDLPCRKVNGIGRVLERELASVGVKTCGDIYPHRQYLHRLFGDKVCEFLLRCYLGLGRTNVQPAEEYERKSVGTESTFRDMHDPLQLRDKLRATAEDLEKDMRRAECKGRTLCLKVKLHTYEVLTRQVVVPKAVILADDLYNYSLPMLARLEHEIPDIKLRLMGLRCTHLVSTKKTDTMAFFGLRSRKSGEPGEQATTGLKRRIDSEGEWEQWPEEEMLNGGDDGGVDAVNNTESTEESPQAAAVAAGSPFRRHGKEILPNPSPISKKKQEQGNNNQPASPPEEVWWDCPICSRPQAADERPFNEHIDLCLSRQTIRDTVQKDAAAAGVTQPPADGSRSATPEVRKSREKKRGRLASAADPRQKKLCFG
ncbi:hypothetical protein B0T17DRAFT_500493 [Bombardia bombarda]|uniref:DNA polymerase kappa n=1 Tax=Bombardia bombarda TaxID=252184 RepID=A0AA39U3N9_9PEZI|nr:hypothetical protein B0T17DRAFT_500493 [Bombardia bombarda]